MRAHQHPFCCTIVCARLHLNSNQKRVSHILFDFFRKISQGLKPQISLSGRKREESRRRSSVAICMYRARECRERDGGDTEVLEGPTGNVPCRLLSAVTTGWSIHCGRETLAGNANSAIRKTSVSVRSKKCMLHTGGCILTCQSPYSYLQSILYLKERRMSVVLLRRGAQENDTIVTYEQRRRVNAATFRAYRSSRMWQM